MTVLLLVSAGLTQAADLLKPFTLASTGSGDVATIAADVKAKLGGAGFEVVGEYTPYTDATIILVTSDLLKGAAGKSKFGGYAAGQRVSITKVGDQVHFNDNVKNLCGTTAPDGQEIICNSAGSIFLHNAWVE